MKEKSESKSTNVWAGRRTRSGTNHLATQNEEEKFVDNILEGVDDKLTTGNTCEDGELCVCESVRTSASPVTQTVADVPQQDIDTVATRQQNNIPADMEDIAMATNTDDAPGSISASGGEKTTGVITQTSKSPRIRWQDRLALIQLEEDCDSCFDNCRIMDSRAKEEMENTSSVAESETGNRQHGRSGAGSETGNTQQGKSGAECASENRKRGRKRKCEVNTELVATVPVQMNEIDMKNPKRLKCESVKGKRGRKRKCEGNTNEPQPDITVEYEPVPRKRGRKSKFEGKRGGKSKCEGNAMECELIKRKRGRKKCKENSDKCDPIKQKRGRKKNCEKNSSEYEPQRSVDCVSVQGKKGRKTKCDVDKILASLKRSVRCTSMKIKRRRNTRIEMDPEVPKGSKNNTDSIGPHVSEGEPVERKRRKARKTEVTNAAVPKVLRASWDPNVSKDNCDEPPVRDNHSCAKNTTNAVDKSPAGAPAIKWRKRKLTNLGWLNDTKTTCNVRKGDPRTRLSKRGQERQRRLNEKTRKLTDFVTSDVCKNHLHGILQGKVDSDLHMMFMKGSSRERRKLPHSGFGPINDEEQVDRIWLQICRWLKGWYGTNGIPTFEMAEYAMNVMVPEALAFGLRRTKGYSKAKAWEMFDKGVHNTVEELRVVHYQLIASSQSSCQKTAKTSAVLSRAGNSNSCPSAEQELPDLE